MPNQVCAYLDIRPGGTYVDMTVGKSAGHSQLILESCAPDGRLIGIDRDLEALQAAEKVLGRFAGRFELYHARFSRLPEVLAQAGVERVDGVLIDAGVSREQMLDPDRSFSFASTTGLDMRMDRTQPLTAWHVVNEYSLEELTRVLRRTGKWRAARRVAAAIVAARQKGGGIHTTAQLAEIIAATVGRGRGRYARRRTHPATPWLMAIRVEVNDELTELQTGLRRAAEVLKPGQGRLVCLSWAGHEHGLVRRTLRELSAPCTCPPAFPCTCGKKPLIRLLTPKGIQPDEAEVARNPSVRSCRLWAAQAL